VIWFVIKFKSILSKLVFEIRSCNKSNVFNDLILEGLLLIINQMCAYTIIEEKVLSYE